MVRDQAHRRPAGLDQPYAPALDRLCNDFPNLVVLTHEANRGYGEAEKTLLRYTLRERAEVGILLHSDGQYSPEKIPELLEPFDGAAADLVQGSRMLGGGALRGGMPLYKFVANKALTALENWAFGMHLAEYHSGYMLYSREALETIPFEKLSGSAVSLPGQHSRTTWKPISRPICSMGRT